MQPWPSATPRIFRLRVNNFFYYKNADASALINVSLDHTKDPHSALI